MEWQSKSITRSFSLKERRDFYREIIFIIFSGGAIWLECHVLSLHNHVFDIAVQIIARSHEKIALRNPQSSKKKLHTKHSR